MAVVHRTFYVYRINGFLFSEGKAEGVAQGLAQALSRLVESGMDEASARKILGL